jgi:hypothetical protein
MANMTDNDPTGSTPPEEEPAPSPRQEPGTSQPAEDPGYLIETGQAAAEDGSVAPIIGAAGGGYGFAFEPVPTAAKGYPSASHPSLATPESLPPRRSPNQPDLPRPPRTRSSALTSAGMSPTDKARRTAAR